jgi:signal transduction histidine kinase
MEAAVGWSNSESGLPRILVVDDDSAIRMLLRESFEDAGFIVEEASNGLRGLVQVCAFRPDLLLLDMLMPEMDGFETCVRIHELGGFEQLPVLMMTGLDDVDCIDRAYDSGAIDVVSKPLNRAILIRRVRQLIESARVTRRLHEAEADREQAAFFRRLVDEFPDPLFVLNSAGKIEYQNPAARKELPNGRGNKGMERGLDFVHPEDAGVLFNGIVFTLESRGEARRFEFRIRNRQELWRVWDGRVVTLCQDPVVNRLLLACRDITELKERESELACQRTKAETMDRAKSEYLAIVSHELRSPLNTIMGYTELMLEDMLGALTQKQLQSLRRIRTSAREVLELTFSVLDLTRLEVGTLPVDPQEVSVPEVLREIRDDTGIGRETSDIGVIWRVNDNLQTLYTDRAKIKMVLRNLITNAMKFTRVGSVTVEARSIDGCVEVCVTDTGIGIPQDKQWLIFDPFESLRDETSGHESSGLGLYVVKRFVEVLGGEIHVESVPGEGSRFTLRLVAKH